MGTSLTGTKPKDTYDSLIKVGDNGPISGTAKYLSDGLGNDLPIAVSTPNVGIGTSAPAQKLSVAGNGFFGGTNANIYIDNGGVGGAALVVGVTGSTNGFVKTDGNFPILIQPNNTTRVRIDSDGLKFNADTAAANALDDYEEGTFTPAIAGSVTAGTATYSVQEGRYTKIGRQVSCQIDLSWSGGTGSGSMRIINLPFNESQVATNPAATIGFIDGISLTASHYALAYIANGSNRIDLIQAPVGGGSVIDIPYDAAGRIIVNVTYLAS